VEGLVCFLLDLSCLQRWMAQTLLNTLDTSNLKSLHDRAILAVLSGGGLRRSEAAVLTSTHVQLRERRWVVCDLGVRGTGRARC